MPKPNKQIIIDEIIKGIENGKNRGQLLGIIGEKWEVSRTTFDRYWKIANEQHIIKQDGIKKELQAIDTAAAVKARKRAIMTAEDRKEYLTKIVLGEVEVPYTEVKWDKLQNKYVTIKFVELAGHVARISAIAELNKMEGDYSPTKVAQTDSKGNDILVSPTIQIINHIVSTDLEILESEE